MKLLAYVPLLLLLRELKRLHRYWRPTCFNGKYASFLPECDIPCLCSDDVDRGSCRFFFKNLPLLMIRFTTMSLPASFWNNSAYKGWSIFKLHSFSVLPFLISLNFSELSLIPVTEFDEVTMLDLNYSTSSFVT